jgi:hypothetical protein
MARWLLGAVLMIAAGGRSEEAAKACMENMVSEAAAGGWSLRTARVRTMPPGVVNHFLFQLYEKTSYEIIGCGPADGQLVRFEVYDEQARLIAKNDGLAPQQTLPFVPTRSGSYYVGVDTLATEGEKDLPVGFAMLYR